MTTEKKYEVTDALRKKYPDINITINKENLEAQGLPPLFIEKLIEVMPFINSSVKDMSIIEAEYMLDKTGLGSMFEDFGGSKEASDYLRFEAYKVCVEKNKDKALQMFQDNWNKAVSAGAEQSQPTESPSI